MPHAHAPAFLHHHDRAAGEEHPHHHYRKDFSHAVEATLEKVEHGVDAIDPLHVFSPNEIPVRLVYKEGALSSTGEAYPVICARSNDPFHHLQVKERPTKSNEFVVEHPETKMPVMMIERTLQPRKYDISMAVANDNELHPFAQVVRSDKVLHVILEGESEPTYIISKAGLAASYATKHWIKLVGKKEPVACTHPWEGNTDMLEVQPGENVILMYCLAAIADEMIA